VTDDGACTAPTHDAASAPHNMILGLIAFGAFHAARCGPASPVCAQLDAPAMYRVVITKRGDGLY
jgi:hypothetical protein